MRMYPPKESGQTPERGRPLHPPLDPRAGAEAELPRLWTDEFLPWGCCTSKPGTAFSRPREVSGAEAASTRASNRISAHDRSQVIQNAAARTIMKRSTKMKCWLIVLFLLILCIVFHYAKLFQAPEQRNREKVVMADYPNSTDDEFKECKEQMYNRVTTQLLMKELNSNAKFRLAWKAAKSDLYLGNTWDSTLTRENLRRTALRAYTESTIYRELNNKMREGRRTYMNKFGFISLHFLITDGIQTRNAEQRRQHECWTTYRRTPAAITITKDFVRFGSFASSSLKATLKDFGSETCFIIYTCFGADISDISMYPQEAEVLIPPYEKFKNEPFTDFPQELSDCKRVYKLNSERKKSNMNCEYVTKDKMDEIRLSDGLCPETSLRYESVRDEGSNRPAHRMKCSSCSFLDSHV
ncbi:hypothetical protein MHYP_G00129840 [Metynnis hypsauchen]